MLNLYDKITDFHHENDRTFTFSHPDFTVGFGISPNPAHKMRGSRAEKLLMYMPPKWSAIRLHYRRSGIAPCPEDESIFSLHVHYKTFSVKVNPFARIYVNTCLCCDIELYPSLFSYLYTHLHWQIERKGCSFPYFTFYFNIPFMSFYNIFRNGQTKTCTALFARTCFVCLVETLKDIR